MGWDVDDDDDYGGQAMPRSPANEPMDWASSIEPPWHFWGQAQILNVPSNTNFSSSLLSTQQLARIDYRRPESWRFLFLFELLQVGAITSGPTDGAGIFCDFEIAIGLGRSLTQIKFFQSFSIAWDGSAAGGLGLPIAFLDDVTAQPVFPSMYSTQVRAPTPRFTSITPPEVDPPGELIEVFPAQTIQCKARIGYNRVAAAGPDTAVVQVGAMFVPNTHVRPDWFMRNPKAAFAGREVGGK